MEDTFKNGYAPVEQQPEVMNKMSAGDHMKMLYKFFFEKGEKVPLSDLPQQKVHLESLLASSSDGLKGAWLGHSSILIKIGQHTVLTDPVFERKVSIVGPKRFHGDLPLEVKELPRIDVVIISHDHYDHLNKYSVKALRSKVGLFIVPSGVGARLLKWGVQSEQIVELNWWQEHQVAEDLRITATPSQHFSGRGLFDRNTTLWASWVISTGNVKVFFSGDSGYFPGFKEIGDKLGPFDMAYLECGAYDERWSNVHMAPEETVQAAIDLGAKKMQPVHWATFNLAFHPWYEPIERVTAEAWNKNVEIFVPQIGEVVDYSQQKELELWWVPAMVQSQQKRSKKRQLAGTLPN